MRQSSIPLSANTDDLFDCKQHGESVLKIEHYSEMGERIKAYRKENGLTLEQAAERLDVPLTTIKLLEKGKSLTMENALRICLGYGCTFADIFPDEFIRYTSPFEKTLSSIDGRQREAMRSSFERTGKRRETIERI